MPKFDTFNSISTEGRSVEDYFITAHQYLKHCKLKVSMVTSLIETLSIPNLLSSKCRAPDHSIVTLTISYSKRESEIRSEMPDQEDKVPSGTSYIALINDCTNL